MAEVEGDKPVSVLDTVRAAVAEHSADPPDIPAQPALPASETAPAEGAVSQAEGARARDEQGRFAKAEGEKRPTLTVKPKEQPAEPKPAAQAVSAGQEQPQTQQQQPANPPAWWKGAGKIDWKRLPGSIQGELSEYVGGLEKERAEVAPLKEMLDLNRETLVREAGSVHEGVRQLLAFHQLSIDRPLDLIQHIARSRGIDLRAAFAGQPQAQPGNPQQPPDIASLVAQAVQQHLAPIQEQEQQRQYQSNLQTVQSFAEDPAHPYFNDVAPHMERLLTAGVAKDLHDAYDQAVWANPTIRAALQAQANEEAEKTRKEAAEKARKAAAASVRGSPVPDVQRGAGGGQKSVRDAVRDAFSEHAGA